MTPSEAARSPSARSPWEVLGVEVEAGVESVREAYLRKVKEFPPDRSPAEFETIRDAYDQLRDPRSRARLLLHADPSEPFVNLLAREKPPRRHVGKQPWLKLLREG